MRYEPLTEHELSLLETEATRIAKFPRGPGLIYIDAKQLLRLLQQARRAPPPAVDRGQEGAGLLAAKEGT